nr:hypothetical protein [Tanacetum cinerariifolium]
MADNRTMAQMLQAPIEGYKDAIVVPPINANNFELTQTLINLVQSSNIMEETHHRWRFRTLPLSLRITEYRDRVQPTTRIIPRRLKTSCVGYCPGFKDLHIL